MKVKSIKKVLSVLLSLVMLVSLFASLTALPASASASDTKMLHALSTATGLKFGWRSDSSTPIAKGVKYRLSLDWEDVSNAPFGSSTFGIYCYVGSWKNIFNNSTYISEWNISSGTLAHGNHYDIDFTLKSSLSECREFVVYFGDINNSISSYEFNTANWILYTRDDSNNLTDTGKTFTFPVTIRGASDGAMNSYINSYTASDRGQLWANNTSSSYTRSFVDIPSGYFDPVEAPAKMLSVNSPDNSTRLKWRPTQDTNVINPSTDYRISFYWENVSNASLDDNNMFHIKYYNNSSWSVMLKANDLNGYAATDVTMTRTDVAHGQKVDIDFTSPADCRAGSDGGSIFFLFGDWDYSHDNMRFNFGELKLYTRDGSDNLTEVSMDDICADTVLGSNGNSDWASSDGLSRGQVYAPAARHSCISFQNVPDGYFDEIDPIVNTGTPQMANVYYGYGWKAFEYNDVAVPLLAGETYVFTVNQRVFSGTPTIGLSNHSNEYFSSNYTTNYSDVTSGNTRTITFTMTQAVSDLRIRVGNYSDNTDVAASFANP
ncbi:MAG: hypothetical protein J6T73_01960, partial [Clostridia bacterium]|nr:hypothetical protein [Clostridia bacterium]